MEDRGRRGPVLLSAEAVDEEIAPDELVAKPQPFKHLFADDIDSDDDAP